jgi:hypothetical protein
MLLKGAIAAIFCGTVAALTIEEHLLAAVAALVACVVYLFGLGYKNHRKCERDRDLLRADLVALLRHLSSLSRSDCADANCPIRKIHPPELKSTVRIPGATP